MPKKMRQDRLRTLLQERKRKLMAELHDQLFNKLGDEYHGEFDKALDAGDVSCVDLLQSVGIKLVDICQEELVKMDEAERKLRQGTYGICEECGREISEERLAAVPYAVRCVEDEERFEGNKIQGRGPTL